MRTSIKKMGLFGLLFLLLALSLSAYKMENPTELTGTATPLTVAECTETSTPICATTEEGLIGTEICVSVFAHNFTNVGAYQHSINYDSSIIRYSRVEINPVDSIRQKFGNGSTFLDSEEGQFVTFTFVTGEETGVTFEDDVELYKLCFTAVGLGESLVEFTGTPTEIILFDGNGDQGTFDAGCGAVNVVECFDTTVVIDSTICSGENVVVGEMTFSETGTFEIPLTRVVGGCDSLVTLNLTVNTVDYDAPDLLQFCEEEERTLSAPSGFLFDVDGDLLNQIVLPEGTTTLVIVSEENGCSKEEEITVEIFPAASVELVADFPQVCAGDSTSLIAVGRGDLIWSTGAMTDTIIVAEGTYTVTLTDDNGCVAVATTTVGVFDPAVVNISGASEVCPGGSTILTAEGMGTVLWSTGQETTSIEVVVGSYSVTLTDENGCTASAEVTVTEFAEPSVSISGTSEVCPGGSTILTAEGMGTVLWSTGQETTSIEVVAGNYSVTLTDENGCTASAEVSVTEFTEPNVSITGVSEICPGGSTILTAEGMGTGLWSTGQETASIEVIAGNYSVTLTDANGCTASAEVTVTEFDEPDVTISGTLEVCPGSSTMLTAVGLGTVLWSTGQEIASIEVVAGTYSVTLTDENSCTASAEVTVTEFTEPSVSISGASEICAGSSTILTAEGMGTVLWSTGQETTSIEVVAGNYSVTLTDANGCTASAELSVTELTEPSVSISGASEICAGGSTILTAEGIGTVLWSTGQETTSIEVVAGNYSVTLTDENGCTASAELSVTEFAEPSVSISGASEICAGGSTILTAEGIGTVLWSTGQETTSIEVVAGNYSVTLTDENGCTASAEVTVTEFAEPSVSISGASEICAGGSTILTAEGMGTVLWSTGQEIASIEVVAGNYSVTLTDENGCTASAEVTVTEFAEPSVSISGASEICAGGSTILTAEGMGTVLWSTGQEIASIEVVAGNYSVTLTDENGCTASAEVTVTEFAEPSVSISGASEICAGGSTILTAEGMGTVLWSTGQETASIEVVAGNYSVTLTDENGCTASAEVTVTEFAEPSVSITGESQICDGTTTTLTVEGNGNFLWSTGEETASIEVGAGMYSVTLTDENGCTAMTGINVSASPAPSVNIFGELSICPGESTLLIANGANSYRWSTGDTTAGIIVTELGNYTVVGTNDNGCTGEVEVTVTGDTIPPVFTFCPADVNRMLNRGNGQVSTAVSWVEPIVEDNCGNEQILLTSNFNSGDVFEFGTFEVIYRATDESGNSATCEFTITIEPSVDLTFYVDTVGYTFDDGVFSVPIRVLNFEEAQGFQFTILASDQLKSRIVAVETITDIDGNDLLPALEFNAFNDNTYTFSWANPAGTGITLPDSTAIFNLVLTTNLDPGECIPLVFVSMPTAIQVLQSFADDLLLPTTIDGDVCADAFVSIAGRIVQPITQLPLATVEVSNFGDTTLLDTTDMAGNYLFEELFVGSEYTIAPIDNLTCKNGLNVRDLLLIRQHSGELRLFDNPYSWVAADVNNDGRISVFDVLEIQTRILDPRIDTFTNNNEWRFIPTSYVFPSPNPLSESFPETLTFTDLQEDATADFFGVRIGDVDFSACQSNPNLNATVFGLTDETFKAGEIVKLTVSSEELSQLEGYQFELSYDAAALTFMEIMANTDLGIDPTTSFHTTNGSVKTIWSNDATIEKRAIDASTPTDLFTITFQAAKAGKLSELVQLRTDNFEAMAVSTSGDVHAVTFDFATSDKGTSDFTLLPNPFSNETSLIFQSNETGSSTLTIYDATGQLINRVERAVVKGKNTWQINEAALNGAGVYFVQLQMGETVISKRLIQL